MKKVVRMLGLCALVALAFTACKKDDTKKVTFTATVTQPTSADRTHAFGYGEYLVWDAGDQIKVFNTAGENQDFALPTNATDLGRQVTFEVVGNEKVDFLQDLATDNAYTAFYPQAEVEGDRVKMVIPDNQPHEPGRNFGNNLYPMYAHNQGDNFVFTSDAGFLSLQFTCPRNQTISINKVVLRSKAADDYLTGNYYYEKDASSYEFVGTGNQITMQFAPVELDFVAANDFTFVLPHHALVSGFEVEVYDVDGNVYPFEAPAEVNEVTPMTYRVMTPKQVGNSTSLQIHMNW